MKMTGETLEVRSDKRTPRDNRQESEEREEKKESHQSHHCIFALMRSFITDLTTIYIGINAPIFLGA